MEILGPGIHTHHPPKHSCRPNTPHHGSNTPPSMAMPPPSMTVCPKVRSQDVDLASIFPRNQFNLVSVPDHVRSMEAAACSELIDVFIRSFLSVLCSVTGSIVLQGEATTIRGSC